MRTWYWVLRLIIPLAVLYFIGYLIPGFSALTVSWIFFLSVLIFLGNWLVNGLVKSEKKRLGRAIIDFLVATTIIFTATLAISGGQVPLYGALLAALIIAVLDNLILPLRTNRV